MTIGPPGAARAGPCSCKEYIFSYKAKNEREREREGKTKKVLRTHPSKVSRDGHENDVHTTSSLLPVE